MVASTNVLISEADDVRLGQLCVCRCINPSIRVVIFGEPDLRLVVDTEIRKLCLGRNRDLSANVCHLQGFLPQVPLVPVIVWFNMFLYEMSRACNAFVDH